MDLNNLLNQAKPTTNLKQDAISTFRRISTGSASVSPASSPAVEDKRPTETFRAPSLSTPAEAKAMSTAKSGAQPKMLDLAYDGTMPLDGISIQVKEAIMHFLTVDPRTWGRLGVEIEAKLGHLTERDSGRPLRDTIPISSDALIDPSYPVRFASDMSEAQHSAFNKHLNQQVETCNPRHPRYRAEPVIRYEHTRLTDSIYAPYTESGREIKPRVTTSDKDGSIVDIISKENIAHMHICCPRDPFDIRLSINIEHKIPAPTSSTPILQRKKDRLSYKLPTHQIDLTKVGDKGTKQQSFELEVELVDLENLKRHADLETDGKSNRLGEIVHGFMSSVWTLNRAAASFS